MDDILNYYNNLADDEGEFKTFSMRDINIRDLEVEKLIEVLRKIRPLFENPKILEVGSGNGYTSEQILKNTDYDFLYGIDFCEKLVEISKQRNLIGASFSCMNALNLEFEDSSFDIVFSERCLINLEGWYAQKKSISEIFRVLKKGGIYIMIESFIEKLSNLNNARKSVGLDLINQPFHNHFFEKKKLFDYIEGYFIDFYNCEENNNLSSYEDFLSSYFYGSKVLYPALIQGKKEIEYNNKFIEFFKYIPSFGEYGYVNLFIFKKISNGSKIPSEM
ncbi:Ubiquinone/menaquinone biosynthesis C-methyltransferase UbiE [anaerobic digester metagenome]